MATSTIPRPAYGWVGVIYPIGRHIEPRLQSDARRGGDGPEATLTNALVVPGSSGGVRLFYAALLPHRRGRCTRWSPRPHSTATHANVPGCRRSSTIAQRRRHRRQRPVLHRPHRRPDRRDRRVRPGDADRHDLPACPPMTKPPQNQYPNQLTVDSNGNIWFTETNLNLIGELDPIDRRHRPVAT